jgi:nucleoside-diphosphate-sugar epimerase
LGVECCLGDLNDTESLRSAVAGCDAVFHVAGLVRARTYQEFDNVNRQGTENLAKVAADCSFPPVFVYVSSLSAAGHSMPDQPKRESDPTMPISKYGKSKLAGEAALLSFSDQMPCTIVRPGIVFGEADKMNLELFKSIKKLGICPIPGLSDKYYSWIHAADLSDLLVAAAQNGERIGKDQPVGTGIYHASSNGGQRLSEIGRLIGHSVGRDRVRTRCLPVVLWIISTFYEMKQWCTGKSQPLDWETMWVSLHHWTCSSEKAEAQLGFSPPPLEERISQTTRWFEENGWLA